MTDTMDAIKGAQAPTTFDVLSFVEGTAYPTDTVEIYTNASAAERLVRLNAERLDNDKNGVTDLTIDDKIAECIADVEASKLTFELRGLPPGITQEIFSVEDDTPDEEVTAKEDNLIASTIVRVVNASGSVDERLWKGEDVTRIRRFVKQGEFRRLATAVARVNFNAAVFDEATDAGFLGRGANLAS